jgi:hypothetical protein
VRELNHQRFFDERMMGMREMMRDDERQNSKSDVIHNKNTHQAASSPILFTYATYMGRSPQSTHTIPI